jgi:hypothetical protein
MGQARRASPRPGFTRADALNPSMGAPGAASMPRTAPRMNPEREDAGRLGPDRGCRSILSIQQE